MVEYFSILIIIIIISLIPIYSIRGDSIKLFFSLLLIFLFMALRLDYGGDYSGYKDFFELVHFSGIDINTQTEIGFQLLNLIFPSYRWIIVVSSLLFCSSIYFLFKRYIPSNHWVIAFIILFISKSMLIGNMSGIRNGLAVSVCIFAFYFLEKNRKILYILSLLFASLFHSSSLFFIPMVFINTKKLTSWNIKFLWILVIIVFLVASFSPELIKSLTVLTISNINVLSKYNFYLENEISYGIRGLSFILIFFMLYMNIKTLKNQRLVPKEVLFIKLSLFFYIVMLLPGIGLLSRLYFYLSFPQLVGNIYVMRSINDKNFRFAYIFGMIIIPLIEFYQFANSERFTVLYLKYNSILF